MRPLPRGDRGQQLQLGLGLDVDAEDVLVERQRQLGRGLADAGEHDLVRRHAGRERALELAAGDDVGAGAELRQGRDHRLVGIGLDRVADQRRHVGEGAGEHAVVPLQRRGGIAIERRADRLREAGEIHRLGVQHAVAIGEVVHGALSRSANRREAFSSALPERSAGLPRRIPLACSGVARRVPGVVTGVWPVPLLEHVAAGRRIERTLAAAGRERQGQGKRADHGNDETVSDRAGTMQAPKFRAP